METIQTIIKPTRDKKPYRLRCRFKIEPHPSMERVDREKVRVAEMFVADMHKQGWEYDTRSGFKMEGPFPFVPPITIHMPRVLTAKDMLSGVANGNRFLEDSGTPASMMPTLGASEWWEYELAGVFIRTEIMVEYADLHEEKRG